MNPIYQNILTLSKAAIYQQQPDKLQSPLDWTNTYNLLRRGKLHGIVYKTVASLPEDSCPDTKLSTAWKLDSLQKGIKQLAATHEIRHVLQNATERGLMPVLFKGLALSALYPEPTMRFTSDVDLFIPAAQRSAMEEMLVNLNYTKDIGASKEHVPVYRINLNNRCLSIELHDCLWEDYTGTQANILQSLNLTNPDTLLDINPFGFPIRTLGYEEHLIYQIFHIAKHFSFEGLRLRFLTDITLFVNAYNGAIDFVHFWQVMEQLGYSTFCGSLFKICNNYFGMTDSILKPEHAELPINEQLLEDIMLAGKVASYNIDNWASTDMLASYFMRDNKVSSGIKRKLEIFFPMPSALKDKFSYAKKCPILLPIAWIHRFFSALRYSIQCKKGSQSASDVLSNAEYRLSLMKSVGLADSK